MPLLAVWPSNALADREPRSVAVPLHAAPRPPGQIPALHACARHNPRMAEPVIPPSTDAGGWLTRPGELQPPVVSMAPIYRKGGIRVHQCCRGVTCRANGQGLRCGDTSLGSPATSGGTWSSPGIVGSETSNGKRLGNISPSTASDQCMRLASAGFQTCGSSSLRRCSGVSGSRSSTSGGYGGSCHRRAAAERVSPDGLAARIRTQRCGPRPSRRRVRH